MRNKVMFQFRNATTPDLISSTDTLIIDLANQCVEV